MEDNGTGIPGEFRDKVLNMFFRPDNRQKYRGTGMGLAIVKKMMERLGSKYLPGKGPREHGYLLPAGIFLSFYRNA